MVRGFKLLVSLLWAYPGLFSISLLGQQVTNLSIPFNPTNNAITLFSMDSLDDKSKLAIGDRLTFRIIEDEDEARWLLVSDSGELETPYLGRIPAAGKTCKQLATELKNLYEKELYYNATVIIALDFLAKNRGKVYLMGEVKTPGPKEIPSDEVFTISKAILSAGGFSDFSDKRKVKLVRKSGLGKGENQTFIVDVSEIYEKGKTDRDLPVEAGDLIFVPPRLITF